MKAITTALLAATLLTSCAYEPIYTFFVTGERNGSYTIYDANGEELETIGDESQEVPVFSETDSVRVVDNNGRNVDRWNKIRFGEYYSISYGRLLLN